VKRLGTTLHTVQKKLIVRGEPAQGSQTMLPGINSPVIDQKRARIGKVLEIFGPVKQPYFVVRPNRGVDASAQVGKKLYVEETSRRDGKWKR